MAQAFVQSVSKSSTGSTPMTSSAFGSSTTTGNLIVVSVSDDGGTAGGITSVTDSKSNTYTKIANEQAGSSTLSMWYAKNITGGASHTVTIAWNTGLVSQASFVAQEFSGCDTSSPLDRFTGATGSSTSPSSGATAATTTDAQLVVGGVAYFGTAVTPSAGSGYTNANSVAFTNASGSEESKVIALAAAQTATFTLSGSRDWSCGVATFKASGAVATLQQEGYGFYNDNGSESTMTTLAAQDTVIIQPISTNTIVRVLINATNDPASLSFQVEYQQQGDSSWTKITS